MLSRKASWRSANQLEHLGLGLRLEVLGHIELAESFAEGAVGCRDHAHPTRFAFLAALHGLAVELEGSVAERRRQSRRRAANQLPTQIDAPVIERDLGQELVERLEVGRLHDVEGFHRGAADVAEVAGDVQLGHQGLELSDRHLVLGLVRVAAVFLAHEGLGHGRLELEHSLGMAASNRRLLADQLEHAAEHVDVGLAQFLALLVAAQVVIAVRQTDTRLQRVADHLAGIVGIRRSAESEGATDTDSVQMGDDITQTAQGADGVDACQLALDGVDAGGFDGCFIHARGKEVVDLLLDAAGGEGFAAGGQLFENDASLLEGEVTQHEEGAPARILGRDFGVVDPGAVGEAIEIVAGTDALVHVSGLDAMIRCHSVLRFKFAVET
jgi:hypothetical protein